LSKTKIKNFFFSETLSKKKKLGKAPTIIKPYWKQSNVPEEFIKCFENEYVLKPVEWHYGSGFAGKSRTNNSLESANRVLKDHYGRKAHNIKEFISKLKDFFRELSSKEK